MSVFAHFVMSVASLLGPLLGASATAAAIVAITVAVRLALHPLARAAARGEKARAALAPRVAELNRKHKKNPERLRKALADLYAKEGASPFAGFVPMLVQLPVFFLMYRVFSSSGGDLLDHTLFGAPLGGRWKDALADGGVAGPHGAVFLGLFAVIAAVAGWTYLRARKAAATAPAAAVPAAPGAAPGAATMAKILPLLSFGTLLTAAYVPLAAGLYLATTTAWSAAERAWLQRAPHVALNAAKSTS
ncbi:YidC/Oxa1 family membrane protein insertase [Streptomyces sp. SID13666]|uniref:YidC/Oxa1 family membrane protein insertase n=1 Tax=unclassified Streptomyces TaxID=2593676 RepID=UPI0013BFA2E1|nr:MULTISPECIES: membrane protein insertase YidC [unclassified Streptomyces]NEA56376.1 YidC/Oxa1 family membrane protein insertase [Streptomyces sp. SID13666]NEA73736.1 YidC/Oxa1 family membrane protein insertase [Streptomyces sp. SID13588]